jgi:hypothetical protein
VISGNSECDMRWTDKGCVCVSRSMSVCVLAIVLFVYFTCERGEALQKHYQCSYQINNKKSN